jgi:hypothetical protein
MNWKFDFSPLTSDMLAVDLVEGCRWLVRGLVGADAFFDVVVCLGAVSTQALLP